MKTKIFFSTFIFLISFSIVYAQSDYKTMTDFKDRYKGIKNEIKYASSLEECNYIKENISEIENDFKESKDLLDKALYPDDFQTAEFKVKLNTNKEEVDINIYLIDVIQNNNRSIFFQSPALASAAEKLS